MKKILFTLLFGFLALLGVFSTTYGAEFYTTYQLNYPSGTPASTFITGGECIDNNCVSINSNTITLYNGDAALICWNALQQNSDANAFNTCINNAKINGNIFTNGGNNRVVTKINVPAPFGSTTIFSASGDSYLVKFDRLINYQCSFDTCFDDQIANVNFEKKANAIAEIGQLNVKNIDNENLPVQVTVPVSIDETVCSAFKYNNANNFRPVVPAGYSDYSANTLVTLDITQNSNGANLLTRSITVPLEADTCGALAAFSWTPSTPLQGEDVTFRVQTDVIDNQVSSSITDFAQVTENMYPVNLDGACWTRAYDFTLSNTPTQTLNPSIAQIAEGESLYALFNAGAFRDQSLTPMNFEARVFFNGALIYQQLLNSGADLKTYTLDLSSNVAGLSSGAYNVTLETSPVGLGCTISKSVSQTQKLQLLVPDLYNVNFYVRDSQGKRVVNADVNLLLKTPQDFFQTNPIFNLDMFTNSLGFAGFTQAYAGSYTYTVNAAGFPQVTNDIFIGSNTDIYVTLVDSNVAPIINLPTELTGDYHDPLTLDITNYVSDFNDAFGDLTITSSLISGNTVINFDGQTFSFTTNAPNTAVVRIIVEDPSGLVDFDEITLNFIDNSLPVVNSFVANPDNGDAPFNTIFTVDVTDADNDPLNCGLDFGDGTSTSGACGTLNNLGHTYLLPGTYNAELTVNDGFNTPVITTEQVIVFNFTVPVPVINSFTLFSSNGGIVPTDLTFNWNVTHEANFPTNCSLRINGVINNVSCVGSFNINGYNLTGTGNFTLIAIDNESTQVIRTINNDFFLNTSSIDNLDVELVTEDVIVPGEFKFFLSVVNETLVERGISIVPTITCGGIINRLSGVDGVLDTSAISQNEGSTSLFEFKLNTQDFKLKVETDRICTLSVDLVDSIGSTTTLSKNVIFAYPADETHIASIRGKGTDVMDYMASVVSNEFKPGYNVISFTIENNDPESREVTMTLISAQLGINILEQEFVGAGAEKRIQIPVFIDENTKKGLYPIRISFYDQNDKQTRYSYLNIK